MRWRVLLMMLSATSAWPQQSDLTRGILAHNAGDQAGAIAAFEAAVKANPELILARLHLGSAYLRRVGTEPDFEKNMRVVGQALQQFEQVLKRDPTNRLAMFQTACGYYFTGNIEEAKGWFRRAAQLNSKDADALVALGYTNVVAATRSQLPSEAPKTGIDVPIADARTRQDLRGKLLPSLEEAQQSFNAAITLNPNDEDALGLMEHVLKRKSELAETPAEYRSLGQQADSAKQAATVAKGKGTRAHKRAVILQPGLPPPAFPFVPSLP